MKKKIDLTKTVFELTREYPDLIEIMAGLGFTEIRKEPVLHSVGKLMTLPKGAKMKKIPWKTLAKALEEEGFILEGDLDREEGLENVRKEENSLETKDLLKSYLRRLTAGESLGRVREDFVKNFKEVDPSEIMAAEEDLLKEGTALSEVQRLCDLHSALFHGKIKEEISLNQEEKQTQESSPTSLEDKKSRAGDLAKIVGHPLASFKKENEALKILLKKEAGKELLDALADLSIHYGKKGDLLYPHLKVRYGISGPSDVMWTVDDEIREERRALAQGKDQDDAWNYRLESLLQRVEEMIYKEENILFPICAQHFSEEDWMGIYEDSKDYPPCFGLERETWTEGEKRRRKLPEMKDQDLVLGGGHLTLDQLTALLNTLPLEITFVDHENINRYFNEGPKLFKRPQMAIDREVFSCHPPKIEGMVRSIIEDFRQGRQDQLPIWMEKDGRTVLVTYMAVRDQDKNYLGTMELVQDMDFAKEHFQEQRKAERN